MRSIDDIASAWADRWEAGPLDAGAAAELDAWLTADRRHRGAWLRARAMRHWLHTADAAAPSIARDGAPAPAPIPEAARTPRGWRRPLAYAALPATFAAAAALWFALPVAPDVATAIGQHRAVRLADGSVAALNTDSALDIAYRPARRDLSLRRGEAWFQVAHNRARPFEVRAGRVHVRATGTAFSVRRDADGVTVVVSEGSVLAWVDGASTPPVAIARGNRAFLPASDARGVLAADPPRPVAVNVDDALAWRRGEIGLDGETGLQAAAEFNRYSTRPIRIRNARAAQYRLVGYFQTSQSLEFARALARLSNARVTQNSNEIVIE